MIGQFDTVEDELVLAAAQVLDLDALRRLDRLAVEEELGRGRLVSHLHFEDDLLTFRSHRILQLLVELVDVYTVSRIDN